MNQPTKDLLAINLNTLEEECRNNPQLGFVWGMELAKVKREVKDKKKAYKLACAELEKNIRQRPQVYDLDKVTDKAVEAIITADGECDSRMDEIILAEYEEDILQAFVYAIVDRKEQLTNLCKLHGQMYFSKPDTSLPNEERMAATVAANKSVKDPKVRKK